MTIPNLKSNYLNGMARHISHYGSLASSIIDCSGFVYREFYDRFAI